MSTPQDRVNTRKSLSELARETPARPTYNRRQYSSHSASQLGCGILAVAVLGLGSVGVYGLYEALNPTKDVTVTVTDKVVKNSKNDSTYLIFTNKGVFEDSDSLVNGKWNSSDLYNELKVGKSYTLHVRGIRNHVLSWYPNILTVKPVK